MKGKIKPGKARLLLCLYPFPPLGGPRSFRWLNLTKELHRRGWAVDVLTVSPSPRDSFYDDGLVKNIPSAVAVHRSFPGIYYSLLHLKTKPVQGFSKTTMEWLPFGLMKGFSLILANDYKAVISSGLPFVGHLVGYVLAFFLNRPWIADYGDSIGFNPMTAAWKRLVGSKLESRMLKRSGGIVVPFPEMKTDLLKAYPSLRHKKIKAVRNGISTEFDRIKPALEKKRFVISYVGSFYRDTHDPELFFRALASLKKIPEIRKDLCVRVAGNIENRFIKRAAELKIQDSVEFLGHVPYSRAISLLKSTSVILYLGGKRNDYHFPYKVIECAASGRPILAVQQSPYDLGAEFILKNKLGRVVQNEEQDIQKCIVSLFKLWKANNLDESFTALNAAQYYWDLRAAELEEFLQEVLKTRRTVELR